MLEADVGAGAQHILRASLQFPALSCLCDHPLRLQGSHVLPGQRTAVKGPVTGCRLAQAWPRRPSSWRTRFRAAVIERSEKSNLSFIMAQFKIQRILGSGEPRQQKPGATGHVASTVRQKEGCFCSVTFLLCMKVKTLSREWYCPLTRIIPSRKLRLPYQAACLLSG